MAGDLTLALRTSQSGLLTNQLALNAVANNVSNVNTPGYSRKIINLEQRVLAGTGAGVQLSSLTRRIDEGLLKSLRLELGTLNATDVQQSYFARTQDLFGSPEDNGSLAHSLALFSAAMETLALTPHNALEQAEMVRRGNEVALQLKEMSSTIQELRQQADTEIAADVSEINGLIGDIADLNDKIVRNSTVSHDVTDLEDQRDAALDRLAELIDIRTFKREDGDVVVFTTGGRVLVDNVSATLTHNAATNVSASTTHAEGDFSGIYAGAAIAGNDISTEIRSGELRGLIDLRDTVLPNLQSSLDEVAAELRDRINQVHNRGLPFPGRQQMTGSRVFTEPGNQRITASGDTVIALFDGNGDQAANTTLDTLMTAGGFTLGGPFATAPRINDIAAALQTWLQANGAPSASASVNADGRLDINVANPALNLAFRDEDSSGARQDVTISFDADGDFNADETVAGFSYFFGLNDFYTDGLRDNLHESDVLSSGFSATAATLTFRNAAGLLGTVAVGAGDSLSDVVSAINSAGIGVTASIVPDGSGVRLRLASDDGASMTVTDAAADSLLNDIGMHSADVRVAENLAVREDILATPALVSRGAVQWDANRGAAGEYLVSVGDDTVIQELTAAFATATSFETAGGLTATTRTFEQYAADILAGNASMTASNRSAVAYQKTLVDSLKAKSDSVRGVNLDEEMSSLLLFEQAYSAAARVISTVQNMFDALDRAVG